MEISAAVSRSTHPHTKPPACRCRCAHPVGVPRCRVVRNRSSAGTDRVAVPVVVDAIVQSDPHPPTAVMALPPSAWPGPRRRAWPGPPRVPVVAVAHDPAHRGAVGHQQVVRSDGARQRRNTSLASSASSRRAVAQPQPHTSRTLSAPSGGASRVAHRLPLSACRTRHLKGTRSLRGPASGCFWVWSCASSWRAGAVRPGPLGRLRCGAAGRR
jgi:hypothetical protein